MMVRRALLALALTGVSLGAAAPPAAGPAPPLGARRVLAPTGFPGWQTRNVTFPVVVRDPGRGLWRMYYTGSATDQVGAAAWDLWNTGVVTSRDLLAWSYPDDYAPVLTGAEAAPRRPRRAVRTRAAVRRDPRRRDVGPARRRPRRRAWYTAWAATSALWAQARVEQVHFRIGQATSPDGLVWTSGPAPPSMGGGWVSRGRRRRRRLREPPVGP